MKLFSICKDGGKDSNVTGLFLVEIKSMFSIAILKFGNGSREAFHSHAFDSKSWLIKGKLIESFHHAQEQCRVYRPSLEPIWTYRNTFHKVCSDGNSYVLTFRGPWSKTWKEFLPATNEVVTLTSGRKRVNE
jgi:hypothetical protein